jgi:hypothetical protein
VQGPVLFRALIRFAAIWATVAITQLLNAGKLEMQTRVYKNMQKTWRASDEKPGAGGSCSISRAQAQLNTAGRFE